MDPKKIDWANLGFDLIPTAAHIECVYSNGEWDPTGGRLVVKPEISMHIAATVLHYGQSVFEGMKAFKMKDGKVRIFRPHLNAQRLNDSAAAVSLPTIPEQLFLDALTRVIKANIDYIPPYGSLGSLYIRPFLFGSGPQIGLSPAPTAHFMILVNPVGDYYKGGMGAPAKALIQYGFDRAAPRGTGSVKAGGNYAPALGPTLTAKSLGFPVLLFLDSKTHTYVEEFATSNFAALSPPSSEGKRVYVTPASRSILPSITNRSLMELAQRKFGWTVERRRVAYKELSQFAEVAACGTAVIITPVSVISRQVLKPEAKQRAIEQIESSSSSSTTNTTDLLSLDPYDLEDEVTLIDPTFRFNTTTDFNLETTQIGDSSTTTTTTSGFKQLYDAYRQLQYGDLDGWEDWGWMWPNEGF